MCLLALLDLGEHDALASLPDHIHDLASGEQFVPDRVALLGADSLRRLDDLRPSGAGVAVDRRADRVGDLIVAELLVRDGESFALDPDELKRLLVPPRSPARLLDVEPEAPLALRLDVKERVASELPGAGDLPALVLVVNQDHRDPTAGPLADVVNERHEVAY